MTIFHRIIYAGTAGLPDKEKLAIKTTNRDAAATGIMVFTFGGIINYLYPLLPFLIAVILEGSAFYLIIYLNHKKRYKRAKMGMYLIHCASATYFGSILGEAMPIEMIASFLFVYLIGSSCLVYRDWRSRNFFIIATVLLWVVVFLNRSFKFLQPAHFPEHILPVVSGLCTTGMLVLMFFTAITLIRQSDRLSKEAEQANKAKTDYVIITSHEIRTVVNGIKGYAEYLKEQESSLLKLENGTAVVKEIDDLGDAAITLQKYLNDQLDMAQIEAGKFHVPDIKTFNLQKLMNTGIAQNRNIARKKNVQIKLVTNLPSLYIKGDEMFLMKIINNLLSNAVKFTADESEVEFSATVKAQTLTLCFKNVSDLSAARAEQIFENYNSERNNQIAGTGLGLSITKSLIDMLHGTIKVHTLEPGHTTFIVTLPYKVGKIIVKNPETPKRPFFPGLKVLLIDDDQMSETILNRLLISAHVEVISFRKAKDALHQLSSFNPDFIISDWNMDDMNGKAFMQQLKLLHIDIPVIIASANHFESVKKEMEQAGAAAIISKPIDAEDFFCTLSDCMHKYHVIS